MQEEKLSYSETCRRFEVNSRDQIKSWERIYLTEGPESLAIERRGRRSTGRPNKLSKQVEEDLLAEVQRLRAENDYLKLASLGFGRRSTPAQDLRGGDLPRWQLRPDAGLRPVAPCGRHPVGQQEVHEYEALRGGSGRRLYCRLTSFSARACKPICA